VIIVKAKVANFVDGAGVEPATHGFSGFMLQIKTANLI
jgi:hypothetical protein